MPKELKTLLQNAVEDYLVSLDEPNLIDAAEVCSFQLSDIFWPAYNEAMARTQAGDPIINGVRQSDAKAALAKTAQNLFQNTVAQRYQLLRQLFKESKTYGFNFSFKTSEGIHHTLPEYSKDDHRLIIACGFAKIK